MEFAMVFLRSWKAGLVIMIRALLAVALVLKGGRTVLKKLVLPSIEHGELKPHFIAQIRYRHLIDKVLAENPNLLLACVILSSPPHGIPSAV